jgi:CarboxypepD_reg-like domain
MRWIRLAIILATVTACGRSPATPSPRPEPPVPPGPLAQITGLRIDGPASVRPAPHGLGQYTATATRADGTTADVTRSAHWSTSQTSVLQTTTTPGQIRGITRGEADVRASYSENGIVVSAEQRVLVLEPGTFKVSGTVTASVTGGPLDFVRVEITSGTGTGIYTFTNTAGEYALYGAAGQVTLTASIEGFEPKDQRLVVSSETRAIFALTASTASVDIAGAWTISFSASQACRANLPPEAQHRQFDAMITQQSAQVVIELSGPTLVNVVRNPRPFRTTGSLLSDILSFTIVGDTGYDGWSTVDLYDHFGPDQWWGVTGVVRGSVSGSEIRAVMEGDLEYWAGFQPVGVPIGVCRAKDHAVTLRRR